jgi:hypothetical protein
VFRTSSVVLGDADGNVQQIYFFFFHANGSFRLKNKKGGGPTRKGGNIPDAPFYITNRRETT